MNELVTIESTVHTTGDPDPGNVVPDHPSSLVDWLLIVVVSATVALTLLSWTNDKFSVTETYVTETRTDPPLTRIVTYVKGVPTHYGPWTAIDHKLMKSS